MRFLIKLCNVLLLFALFVQLTAAPPSGRSEDDVVGNMSMGSESGSEGEDATSAYQPRSPLLHTDSAAHLRQAHLLYPAPRRQPAAQGASSQLTPSRAVGRRRTSGIRTSTVESASDANLPALEAKRAKAAEREPWEFGPGMGEAGSSAFPPQRYAGLPPSFVPAATGGEDAAGASGFLVQPGGLPESATIPFSFRGYDYTFPSHAPSGLDAGGTSGLSGPRHSFVPGGFAHLFSSSSAAAAAPHTAAGYPFTHMDVPLPQGERWKFGEVEHRRGLYNLAGKIEDQKDLHGGIARETLRLYKEETDKIKERIDYYEELPLDTSKEWGEWLRAWGPALLRRGPPR